MSVFNKILEEIKKIDYSRALKTFLLFSGLVATGIGAVTLFAPVNFLGRLGIDLVGEINLLSSIRAAGSAFLASGIVIILGVFVPKLTYTSTIIATLMFLSYGIARIFSMAIDGMPADGIVAATVLEMFIGLAGVFALLKYQENKNGQQKVDM